MESPWWGLFGLLLVIGWISQSCENTTTQDPCSDTVMEAPYEVGSEYWDRDQAGERVAACMNSRLDTFED